MSTLSGPRSLESVFIPQLRECLVQLVPPHQGLDLGDHRVTTPFIQTRAYGRIEALVDQFFLRRNWPSTSSGATGSFVASGRPVAVRNLGRFAGGPELGAFFAG